MEGQKTGCLELRVAAPRSPGAAEKDARPMKASLLPPVLAAALLASAPAWEAPARRHGRNGPRGDCGGA